MKGISKNLYTSAEEMKRLIRNIFSLSILQGANYIFPLLTVPYLVRVLGPENFGLLAFATAVVTYFILLTDYGFNLSATQKISIYRDDKDKINEIFSSVMMIKIALIVISAILMSILVFSFTKFSAHWEIYFLTFGIVIGQAIFPLWLFQGLEHMKYITYINILAKGFSTISIFIFVNSKDDYWVVPLLTSIGYVVAGIMSLILCVRQFRVSFKRQKWCIVKNQIKEGWHVFFSSMAISFYTISTTVILGIYANNAVVGFFSAADKIIQAVKGIYKPISQAIYPMISKKIHSDKQSGLKFIRKFTFFIGILMLIITFLFYFLAEEIVYTVLGERYKQSVQILEIMAFVPFIVVLSNIYGVQTMLNLGYKQAISKIMLGAAILGIYLSFALVPVYEGLGSAYVILVVELFVTLAMYIYLKKKEPRYDH